MLKDMDMITHSFPGTVHVIPVADVHLGALECSVDAWEAFLKRVLAMENTYLILAGDLLNNSVRGAGFANPFDEVLRPKEAKKRMVEYLEPVRDRILCVVSGNHERRTLRDDDQDLTYDICTKLDIEHLYRENMAFMRLRLGQRENSKKPDNTYAVCVTHGAGGGIYTGAAVNRDERFGNVIDGLDCLVAAHVHKGFVSKPSKIVIDVKNGQVCMRHYTVISCVSWLNYGGYAAQKMLLPAHVSEPQVLTFEVGSDGKRKKITTTW